MTRQPSALGVAAFLGVFALLGGSLAGLLGLGVNIVAGDLHSAPVPECPGEIVAAAPLSGMAVKVHNSSNVEGLAAGTAKSLKKKGIKVVSVANKAAPETPSETSGVIITAASKQLPEAVALQALFPESVFLLDDAEPVPSVYLTRAKPKISAAPVTTKSAVRCVLD
ncbi:LytR C-terminal domain-containing protein [Arthrobacter sp. TMN-49]